MATILTYALQSIGKNGCHGSIVTGGDADVGAAVKNDGPAALAASGDGAIAVYGDERRPPSPALPMLTSSAARHDEPESSTVRTGESGPHHYQ